MKSSLEWFKLDVHLDDKFQLIEAEYGLKGFAVVVKLLQKIYGSEGYYCEWTDEVALLFSRKECGEGGNVVSDIVASAIKRGIFDKELFDRYHILTSAGIQKRYLEAVNRRKDSKIKDEYLLINCTQKSENDDISGENVDISGKNVDISEQKRREEKRKEKKRIDYKEVVDLFHDTCVSYPRITALSDKRKAAIGARLKMYSVDDFRRMFEKAEASSFLKGANNRNWRANFDWLMCDSNFAKVLDGNYDNRETTGKGETDNVFLKMLQDEYGQERYT